MMDMLEKTCAYLNHVVYVRSCVCNLLGHVIILFYNTMNYRPIIVNSESYMNSEFKQKYYKNDSKHEL